MMTTYVPSSAKYIKMHWIHAVKLFRICVIMLKSATYVFLKSLEDFVFLPSFLLHQKSQLENGDNDFKENQAISVSVE